MVLRTRPIPMRIRHQMQVRGLRLPREDRTPRRWGSSYEVRGNVPGPGRGTWPVYRVGEERCRKIGIKASASWGRHRWRERDKGAAEVGKRLEFPRAFPPLPCPSKRLQLGVSTHGESGYEAITPPSLAPLRPWTDAPRDACAKDGLGGFSQAQAKRTWPPDFEASMHVSQLRVQRPKDRKIRTIPSLLSCRLVRGIEVTASREVAHTEEYFSSLKHWNVEDCS